MSLVQMTLSGGAFILLIVLIRVLALHRLPKVTFLILWEMAALRLLLPFSIHLPFSVLAPIGRLLAAGKSQMVGGVPALTGMGIPDTPALNNTGPIALLSMIWLVGTVLMAACFVVIYLRTRRRFRVSIPVDTAAVRGWLAYQRLYRPLEVRQSAQISSPLAYGILRPVILLPVDMECGDETALTYILTHEFVHIWRFDGVVKLVFAAVLCVHWVNPLVWVLYILANRDLEPSCDERVIDTLGGREKTSYALTLINMAEAQSQSFSLYNHFSKLAIEERIEAIMKYKKVSILAIALAVALVIGATTAFATSAIPAGVGKEVSIDELDLITGNVGTEIDGIRVIETDSRFVDLDDLNYVEGGVGTEIDGIRVIETDSRFVDLDNLNYVEGGVGTEIDGIRVIETDSRIADLADLDYVEGTVGTEAHDMKIIG